MSYITLAIGAILISNVILEQFLGVCPFLGTSNKKSQAIGMGLVVIGVVFLSSVVTYGIYHLILAPFNLQYLQILSFILVIAGLVQFSELLIKKYFPNLYKGFGIFLPLITTNCIVLGTALNNIILYNTLERFNFLHMMVYSLAIPIGYLLVIFLFSSIRETLDKAPVPKYFKGIPVALITAAFMAMAFKGFVGLI